MNNQHHLNFFERFNQWLRESITVKLASIGLLVLILLIPAVWIHALMEERQQRAETVIAEVSNKWSGAQILAGPALALPYLENETIYNADGKLETRQVKHIAYFLPEQLDVKTVLKPCHLHRGIYDVVVYESNMVIDANFQKPDFGFMKIKPAKLLWEEAYLIIGISDLRGISKEAPSIRTGNISLTSEPSQDIPFLIHSSQNKMTGIRIPLNWPDEKSFEANVNLRFNLKGSGNLRFVGEGGLPSTLSDGAAAYRMAPCDV
ncbi:MAG: cell envelope integrity protein CreD [Cyclobacteriaceae bacterium]|nr:cell envelope integrity protein CreD [Cyclobacteriaceae bacterium]